jgi:hypothetical protein
VYLALTDLTAGVGCLETCGKISSVGDWETNGESVLKGILAPNPTKLIASKISRLSSKQMT